MRVMVVVAALGLLSSPALAQQRTLLVRIDNGGASTGNAGDVIARRGAMRAWQDSVEVYLERADMPQGWRLAPAGASSASYLVSVVAIPISKPGFSAVAMAVAVMEPGTLVAWKYVTHYVAVAESAEQAATVLASGTLNTLRTMGRQ